jgi:hypothetical protein
MRKKPKRKPGDVKRLFELLGTTSEPTPVNLNEARMLAELAGSTVENRQGYRMENDCMKVCFTSESQAKAAARQRLNVGSNVGKLRQYYCTECKAWHMTSSFHIGNK